MSRPLDVWNTANSGSSERYLWPRYQTDLTCYNKLREALSDYIKSYDNTMKILILRLLSMFLWRPGVPALESELTRFLCSVSSLHEAVHHKSDGSLWAVLSSAAEDAATWCSWCAWVPCTSWWSCCHQLCSFSVFVVGVATGQCSWSCSSPNHPGGIADTVGPQLEDLQHCCLGDCCLNNSAWRKSLKKVWSTCFTS